MSRGEEKIRGSDKNRVPDPAQFQKESVGGWIKKAAGNFDKKWGKYGEKIAPETVQIIAVKGIDGLVKTDKEIGMKPKKWKREGEKGPVVAEG